MLIPTTTISHQPTFKLFSTYFSKPLKPFSSPKIPTSKLVFSIGLVSNKPFVKRKSVWGTHTVSELMTTNAYRRSEGDEGFQVLEQEAFVNGPSGFRERFMADGLESTINRLSKWLVAGLFGAIIIRRHDAEAIWAALGSVLNAGLSNVLKQILNQERPISTLRSDPGMPSSHAQSIFFIVVFAILSMVEWLGVNELTVILSLLVLAFGSYLSWLRVSQQLHTISQILVGATVGTMFSALWFWSWDAIVLKAFTSSFWIQIIVILGAAAFCVGFLIYVIRYWLTDDER